MDSESVDMLVDEVTMRMIESAVASKWDALVEDLLPYVTYGDMGLVEAILQRYFPLSVELNEQLKEVCSGRTEDTGVDSYTSGIEAGSRTDGVPDG